MTPDEAADLAARTLAAIDGYDHPMHSAGAVLDADRERVASDLAGLRDCFDSPLDDEPKWFSEVHAARYSDGLRRTAALYGVTP